MCGSFLVRVRGPKYPKMVPAHSTTRLFCVRSYATRHHSERATTTTGFIYLNPNSVCCCCRRHTQLLLLPVLFHLLVISFGTYKNDYHHGSFSQAPCGCRCDG